MTDALASTLLAAGPDPAHADALATFGRFAGTWDLVSTRWHPDGTPFQAGATGTWTFGWALRGRGMIDVLDGEVGFGVTTRTYQPSEDAWNVAWNSAASPYVLTLVARREGARIVLRGESQDGLEEWSFDDIAGDRFVWRSRVSPDDGVSWYVDQEMRCTRRATPLASHGMGVRHSTA